jgi:hypothetical protein
MITVYLILALSDFPFPMFYRLQKFDTLAECKQHISENALPDWKPRMVCIQVVSEKAKEI